jgi:hypothetical protein
LQRLAFRMHAVPIQISAMIQIAVRVDTGENRQARMAVRGIHHANKLVCVLPSQSREVWTVSFAMMALSRATRGCARFAGTLGLFGRARRRTVGAEYAAIARLRPQPHPAAGALIEELTGIGRHGFRFCGGAVGAGDDGFQDHGVS